MARLADRYSLVFLAVTVVLAGGAWLVSDDPIRAVAVLVVATPCPLILAVPIAWISGMSRAARTGILIKSGAALELMGAHPGAGDRQDRHADGRPARSDADRARRGQIAARDVLRLAASLDQASQHVVAAAIVAEAHKRGLALSGPGRRSGDAGRGQ